MWCTLPPEPSLNPTSPWRRCPMPSSLDLTYGRHPKVQAFAGEENVDMRFYNVIYDVIKDVKGAMVGLMESTYKEHVMGYRGSSRSFSNT